MKMQQTFNVFGASTAKAIEGQSIVICNGVSWWQPLVSETSFTTSKISVDHKVEMGFRTKNRCK